MAVGLLLAAVAPVGPLLAFHLATVMVLFLLLPFSKMVHGFYRLAALAAEAGAAEPRTWAKWTSRL